MAVQFIVRSCGWLTCRRLPPSRVCARNGLYRHEFGLRHRHRRGSAASRESAPTPARPHLRGGGQTGHHDRRPVGAFVASLLKVLLAERVPQCGYCQFGHIMSEADLLKQKPKPTRDEIVDHMSTNICRCGTYPRIVRAIERASRGG